MPLSPSALAGAIQSNMQAAGAKGSNLQVFCSAIAAGIVMSIVGKPFTTQDTGLVPGIGAGIGTGITGLSSSAMKSTALAAMSSRGENADKMMQAIMDGVVSHLSGSAILISNNTPVFLGSGTVNVGSILVVAPEMGGNISSQLSAVGANGENKTNLAMAIAAGVCSNILSSGTGTVTITGTFTGSVPPGPVPGSGSGVGVIS